MVRNTTISCNTAATDFDVWKHNFLTFWKTTSVLKSRVWLFELQLIKFEKNIRKVLINCNECFETPYSANPIPILVFHDWTGLETSGSTVNSRPLNCLEHCICTNTMINIRPDQDSNLVPPGYKPQSILMSHRGSPSRSKLRSTQC